MRRFVIGDVHGCVEPLRRLLDRLGANLDRDRFLFVGDIVNRGPASLETLNLVRGLGDRAIVTLGNHDLHLLAVLHDIRSPGRRDTLDDILAAPDRDAIVDWLRTRAVLHDEPAGAVGSVGDDEVVDHRGDGAPDDGARSPHPLAAGFTMVHAGLHPSWSLAEARARARTLETALRADDYRDFLAEMYGNEPAHPDAAASTTDALRASVNVFTRLRYCRDDGALDFDDSGPPASAGARLAPWYAAPPRRAADRPIVFGHWSAHPAMAPSGIVPLDRGCVWAGWLAGIDVDRGVTVAVPAGR